MDAGTVSCSWWLSSHNSQNQSQWLQTTLSDLDGKTNAILTLLQEEGDSFAQRAEMIYKKKPELIKMVRELHKSHRLLAERHDQLKSDSLSRSQSSSSSNSFKHIQSGKSITKDIKLESPDSQSIVEDDISECNISNYDELVSTEPRKVDSINDYKFFASQSFERETVWSSLRLQVSKLMEDNLKQQAELIKRNDDKREAIKELCSQLDKVTDQKRAFQNCLKCSKVGAKHNQSQMSKLKRLIVEKLLG